MATKTAKATKTRNPDRRNGKAWGKGHNAPAKVFSREAQERRAHKRAERERARTPRSERGFSVTMPKINWEWVTEAMNDRASGRRTVTRRSRVAGMVFALECGRGGDS